MIILSTLSLLSDQLMFLRALKSFRPLRFAFRIHQIRVVLTALWETLPRVLQTLFFCVLFWMMLGIIGVNLFSNQFHHCTGLDDKELININTKQDCLNTENGVWENLTFNFDNLGEAIHTIFIMSTLSGWNDIMYHGTDVTGIDQQPKRDNYKFGAIYFVVTVAFAAFFTFNMILSTVIEHFKVTFYHFL